MQKILISLAVFGASLGYTNQATADLNSDIQDCAIVQNEADRLDCYDTVSRYYQTRQKLISPDSPSAKVTTPSVAPVNSPLPTVEPAKPKAQAQINSANDSFGKADDEKIESIQSRIMGKFSGWKKGMKINLENGQIWKVTSQNSGYRKMTNPGVIISRGVFGSFNAKVEGLNSKAKVKRIK